MNEKITKALNEQINKEMESAYLYLGMAVHFEAEALPGFAHWMQEQAKEEMEHALKIYRYLFEIGAKPVLGAIGAQSTEYGKPIEVVKKVLEHEKFVTASITSLYELAIAEKDYKTQSFLTWFINEQVEEEANVTAILDKFRYIDNNAGLMILDRELAARA
ncbi:ferritin [Treponema sp. OMZ 787]|uniref:ferritin n=1 Tax=Treponema sp. OMZ 787 TaxID=2563669 RepID=UPI0020A2ADD6|nr:ferritin [Treponema sp. OMZ 787]UTC62437.1 ferritin [Treponema sp. OMZ 787]